MNYIISIINPDSLSILMDLCNQLDLPLSITMAGRGTAVQSMLDLLGIESNERRIVFTVANEEKTKKVISNETKEKIKQFLDVKDISEEFSKEEVEDNKLLGVLSYCGVFALIPYFSNRKSKYVEFHSIQGMNLLITMICYIITYSLLSLIKVTRYVIDWGYMVGSKKVTPLWITLPMTFIGILIFIIMIYGIINACNGKSKTLPIINKIKVIK